MSTTSESLDELFKSFRVDWYRCPIDRATLRGVMQKSDLQGWFQTLGHLALAGVTAALAYNFFTQQLWPGFALALFAHGTVASNFLYACHELGHGTVFKTRWLNALFLRVYSVLAWWNFHEYAMSHTYHHVYTLHPRADKEVVLPAHPSIRALYLLQLFTLNVAGGFAPPVASASPSAALSRRRSAAIASSLRPGGSRPSMPTGPRRDGAR